MGLKCRVTYSALSIFAKPIISLTAENRFVESRQVTILFNGLKLKQELFLFACIDRVAPEVFDFLPVMNLCVET